MKVSVAILLAFSVLLVSFSNSVIVLKYELNQKYIAAALCENKNMPEKHCNGKCYLKKQLDQQQKKEQNNPGGNIKDSNEVVYFCESNQKNIFSLPLPTNHHFYFTEAPVSDFSFSIFHPPGC